MHSATPEAFPAATVLSLQALVDYQPGAVVSRTLAKSTIGTLTLFSFTAGQGLSEHSAPYDAFVQVLDGRAEIRIGGQSHLLGAGDIILMPKDIPHAVAAVENFKMLLTMFKPRPRGEVKPRSSNL